MTVRALLELAMLRRTLHRELYQTCEDYYRWLESLDRRHHARV